MTERGQTLGRYELLSVLGRGTVFETFKARSFGVEGFEKKLVLKRLLPAFAKNQDFVTLFVEEAQRALRLSHANVAQVFDLGQVADDGDVAYFMATEFVAGVELEALIRRSQNASPWPIALCLYIAAEVTKALDHAHRRRDENLRALTIVHGAVSPRNVLISWDGDVKLTDFGMTRPLLACNVKLEDTFDHVYAALSPEQAAGEIATPASDVFSVGSLLYEILAGVNPFATQSGRRTLERVRSGVAPPPTLFRRDLPGFVSDLVSRALSRRPAERPASASLFFEELSDALYRLEASAGSEDLAAFVERYREATPEKPDRVDVLLNRPLSIYPPPVDDRETNPSLPPFTGFSDTRHVSALLLEFRQRSEVPPVAQERGRELVRHYGGYIVQESPRHLAALFGVEQGDGGEAQTAVHCGLVLVRSLAVDSLRPAVGIHVGRLRVQQDGTPVIDDVCDRLFAEARHAGAELDRRVIVSRRAAKYLRGRFALQEIGDVFAVSRATPYSSESERFVGRRTELSYLADLLVKSSRGMLQIIAVAGDAGVGKTRLLEEMRRRLNRGGVELGFYIAVCPVRGRDLPYSGVVTMLRRICGIAEGDFSDALGMETPLRALGLAGDEMQAVISLLGTANEAVHPTTAALLSGAVMKIFQRLSDDGFQVFAWDDAQELDASSVQVLSAACARLTVLPITFLFSMRPEADAPYAALPFHCEMQLGELEPEDASRLLARRLGVNELSPDVWGFVEARAGGHPMFIEELARHMLDSAAVVVEQQSMTEVELSRASDVPSSLQALIAGRLRRLPAIERDIVVAASVLDDPANVGVFAAMLEIDVPEADQAASLLEARGILRRNEAMALALVSPLWRDVVLSEIEPAIIADLHARAAEAYQRVLGSELEQEAYRIGRHLAAAGQADRAADFYATSGLHHLGLRKLHRAVVDLASAIDLADLDARAGAQLGNWVRALSHAVRYVRAGEGIQKIIDKVQNRAENDARLDKRLRVQLLVDVAVILGALQRHEEARRILESHEEDARKWPQAARALFSARGDIAAQQGEPLAALQALEQAVSYPAGDSAEQHRVAIAMALAFSAAGKTEQARSALERATSLVPGDDIVLSSERLHVQAVLFRREGQWRHAAEAARLASAQSREAGLLYESAVSLIEQALALLRVGELLRAQDSIGEALELAIEIGAYRPAQQAKLLLSYVSALNSAEPQINDVTEALFIAEREGWTGDVLLARYLLATLLVRQGSLDWARREFMNAIEQANATGNRVITDDCRAELRALDVG